MEKVNLLKNSFKTRNIDAYLVPSYDEFQNEYSPECLQRLKWLTNFSGSNGLALITKDKNYLFTDGRKPARTAYWTCFFSECKNALRFGREKRLHTQLSPWV